MQTNVRLRALAGILTIAILAACAGGGSSTLPPSPTQLAAENISHALPGVSPTPLPAPTPPPSLLGGLLGLVGGVLDLVIAPACSGLLHCNALQNTSIKPNPNPHPAYVPGFTPAQLRSAYGLAPSVAYAAPNGPTIAIVDAFDDPAAESDLAVYRSQFKLPPCTTANGCFSKLNGNLQRGGYPAANTGWSMEISLDLAMASTACPTCHITLVEAASDDAALLAQAVDAIAAMHPASISNSYGIPESADALTLDAHYSHPGIAITASVGDQAGVEFPAASDHVVAIGGTTLVRSRSTRGWSETALANTGIGCSAYVARPSWQSASCAGRGVADVSFDGNPATGFAVFDTRSGGWIVLGGTSAGAPFVAGLFAAAGDFGAASEGASFVHARSARLNRVYSLPAGDMTLGSPNGLGAF